MKIQITATNQDNADGYRDFFEEYGYHNVKDEWGFIESFIEVNPYDILEIVHAINEEVIINYDTQLDMYTLEIYDDFRE